LLPYVQLVGAALLLWIGVKLVAEDEGDGPEIAASDRLSPRSRR
jgi:threonine/homoserine/homoserine lactone efflux protein